MWVINWYHWLSFIIIDYHLLSLIIIDYHWLSLIIIQYTENLIRWLTHSVTTWNQEMLAHLKIISVSAVDTGQWRGPIVLDIHIICPHHRKTDNPFSSLLAKSNQSAFFLQYSVLFLCKTSQNDSWTPKNKTYFAPQFGFSAKFQNQINKASLLEDLILYFGLSTLKQFYLSTYIDQHIWIPSEYICMYCVCICWKRVNSGSVNGYQRVVTNHGW